jgi:hypothetical protein
MTLSKVLKLFKFSFFFVKMELIILLLGLLGPFRLLWGSNEETDVKQVKVVIIS